MIRTIRVTRAQAARMTEARRKAMPRILARANARAAREIRDDLVRHTPVDRGQTKNAWRVRRTLDAVSVVNDSPVAGILEEGARPHPVSYAGMLAIYDWVRRHAHYFTSTATSGKKSFVVGPTMATRGKLSKAGTARASLDMQRLLWPVVMGIVRKLRTKGQKPRYFVRARLPFHRDILMEAINAEVDAFIARQAAGSSGAGGPA